MKAVRRLALTVSVLAMAASASAATAAPVWNVESRALPTTFAETDGVGNEAYDITIENLGSSTSKGIIKVEDTLPQGITTQASPEGGSQWSCSTGPGQTVVTCESTVTVAPASTPYDTSPQLPSAGHIEQIVIPVQLSSYTSRVATNNVTVAGGEASLGASARATNPVTAGPDNTAFGLAYFTFHAIGPAGEEYDRASGHPYALTTTLGFNQSLRPGATNAALSQSGASYENAPQGTEARTVVADLPLGLVGDPQAGPRCAMSMFSTDVGDNENACPADTRVGVAFFTRPGLDGPFQVFNLAPEDGHAAEFGLDVAGFPIVLYGDVVRVGNGYTLRVTGRIPQANVRSITLTFFGDPAATFGTGETETAFLANPVDCAASEEARTLQLHTDTWTQPGEGDPFDANFTDPNWIPAGATLPPIEDCGALTFNPSLGFDPATEVEGGTTQADAPSGYNVNLEVPQNEEYSKVATPELKTAKVTLPAGLSVSPSAANGLETCSSEQIALESNEPGSCPPGSQLGRVKITTPLLEEALEGEVFLGRPECSLCTEADATEGKTFRLFIQVHSQKLGITIKLPGTVSAAPTTGQLTAEFRENPQLPFSDLEFHFKNGPRAPLANPQTCGTFTTVSSLEPWSAPETPTAISESSFTTTGCGSSLAFNPSFAAGLSVPQAAGSGTFSVSFGRGDGEQDLGGITVHTPPGLLERMAGVAKCGEAEVNSGTCPAASQIGTTTVSAGPGSNPYTIDGGKVYLTGPYQGNPFGLAITVPAEAGPFHLAGNTGTGLEVVRAAISVNPTTATLTVASGALPQIIDGVPIRLRTVNVEINRPGFMLNATNCAMQAITATITGEHALGSSEAGKSSSVSTPYAANGCASLPFKPSFSARTQGTTSKKEGASLDVKVAQGSGEANIRKVEVQLPKILAARLQPTLNSACGEQQFASNPAGCPVDSFVGIATAVTPALDVPLSGPAIFVSHGGAAFPDLDVILQGEGVTVDLTGHTQIKGGITYSRFETVPDAPISSFELNLPEGPHSAVTAPLADGSLCGQKLELPTAIEGQNGAIVNQTTRISVTGCTASVKQKPTIKIEKIKVTGSSVEVTLKTSAKGRVRVSGGGLKAITKKGLKAGSSQVKVKLTKAGETYKSDRKKVHLTVKLTVGKQVATDHKRIKL